MSQLSVNAINKESGSTLTLGGSGTTVNVSNMVPDVALSNRNLIINGAMNVAQRGTSKASVGQEYATVDRFRTNGTTGTFTMSQESDGPSGFSKSLKMLATANITPSASDLKEIYVALEGQDLQHLKKGTSDALSVTLSFYVKSNITGTKTVYLLDKDNTRLISSNYTINSSGTWEKKEITFSGDTTGAFNNDNGRSLDVHFPIVAGTDYTSGTQATSWAANSNPNRVSSSITQIDAINDYWQITGIQLEVGSVATPFEHETFGETLQKCQRYYQKSYDVDSAPGSTDNSNYVCMIQMANSATSTANAGARTRFVQRLRAAPSVTVYAYDGTSGNLNYSRHSTATSEVAATVSNIGSTSVLVYTGSASGMTAGDAIEVFFHYTADAEL